MVGGICASGLAARNGLRRLGALEFGDGRLAGEPVSYVARLAVHGAIRSRLGGRSGVFSSPSVRRFSRGQPARVAMDGWRRLQQTLWIRALAGRETRASIVRGVPPQPQLPDSKLSCRPRSAPSFESDSAARAGRRSCNHPRSHHGRRALHAEIGLAHGGIAGRCGSRSSCASPAAGRLYL